MAHKLEHTWRRERHLERRFPVSWWDRPQGLRHWEQQLQLALSSRSRPHTRLWAAVFINALSDLGARPPTWEHLPPGGARQKRRQRAREALSHRTAALNWIWNPGDPEEPGTLAFICHVLDLSEELVRKDLLEDVEHGQRT